MSYHSHFRLIGSPFYSSSSLLSTEAEKSTREDRPSVSEDIVATKSVLALLTKWL